MKIVNAKNNFYEFCKLIDSKFYSDDKPHLKDFCNTLQAFVEGKLNKKTLIIELPPRHGKTRTLVLLSSWLMGKDESFKIISVSYNDDTAVDFSRYTRDAISEKKNIPTQIVYSDIFDAKIKVGNASIKEWALEGQFFSYKGAGVGGSVTSKGGNLIIVDDPIKNAEEAFNENHLLKLWTWFTGTLLSREEHAALKIICHTPWAKTDIGGRIQHDEEWKGDYYLYSIPAMNKKGEMLCESILSKEEYLDKEKKMDRFIFNANYKMKRIDVKGLLYGTNFKTYSELPSKLDANNRETIVFERKAWCDTADEGSDFFCQIFGKVYNGYCYVTDVIHSDEGVEITEKLSAEKIVEQKTQYAKYESNSGGHAIYSHIEQIVRNVLKWTGTIFEGFTQHQNKEARILANCKAVLEYVIMPVDWQFRWPSFYKAVTEHVRKGKNRHDDAPDVLTMIVEDTEGGAQHYFIKRN